MLLFWLYSAPSLVLQKRDCALAYLQHNGLLVVQIIADGWLLPLGGRSATAPVSCFQHVAVTVRGLVYFLELKIRESFMSDVAHLFFTEGMSLQ